MPTQWLDTIGSLALARLPEGGEVVVARVARYGSGQLERWDPVSGQPVEEIVSHPALGARHLLNRAPLAVAETPGGPVIVTDSAGGGLRRWDVRTGRATGGVLGPAAGAVWALAAA